MYIQERDIFLDHLSMERRENQYKYNLSTVTKHYIKTLVAKQTFVLLVNMNNLVRDE